MQSVVSFNNSKISHVWRPACKPENASGFLGFTKGEDCTAGMGSVLTGLQRVHGGL